MQHHLCDGAAACAWRCSTVKRHFPFSLTRFTPSHSSNPQAYSVLNMFTSLHDARSAPTNEKHASQRRKHFCCRCDAVTRRVQQSASEHQSPYVPLTDDVCSGWLARWRRQLSFACCGRPRMSLDEFARLASCSDTLFDTITQGRAPKNAVQPSKESTHATNKQN
jgi:hypothetical protein